ncbi:Holliday junction branch migration protein RuvA [Mycoplasma struthionis]|uniref:Holliday junction branch migration complex subunit RuvA n=1 Tax=Mycoplasma struthionis TaxID=538220 RepID=A0A3G8LIU7_9MOLU|nr:Holliday junction branch migration protein RuvA [Mycoplasma struthionis]AZG68812.1 Holliday junction branch migration protein RuvA [Mycoplasma struthionis]TPI01586.1 Holliday junction branch migration protein RuvA [Mycoplasma struthionis]
MKIYIYGKIVHVNTNYLILEHHGQGDLIYVPNIQRFKKDENKKIFISNFINEYNKVTYGFENFKELVIFEDLIMLQGLGPKTAISILNAGWELVLNYIAEGNSEALANIPYVSTKIANNIIFAYKEKYNKFLAKMDNEDMTKIKEKNTKNSLISKFEETMKMLGFKNQQISYAMSKMQISENIEQSVEEAIKLISQRANETRV